MREEGGEKQARILLEAVSNAEKKRGWASSIGEKKSPYPRRQPKKRLVSRCSFSPPRMKSREKKRKKEGKILDVEGTPQHCGRIVARPPLPLFCRGFGEGGERTRIEGPRLWELVRGGGKEISSWKRGGMGKLSCRHLERVAGGKEKRCDLSARMSWR